MKSCATCQSSFPARLEVCPRDGTPLRDADSWLPGTVVRGKYVIFSKIAEGRASAVYKARELQRDEARALKALRADLEQDALLVKRFKNESLIARRLKHAHIARVETSDQSEHGRPFLVMEYVEGRTLKRALQEEGRFTAPRVCSISRQIGAALEAAHRLGIVHGDLNPASVILTGPRDHELVKVLGFCGERVRALGVSDHRLNGAPRQLQDFAPAAPEYVSPEQAGGGRGDELDGRADLYSLGVLMYEMLAGTPPFQGFSSELTLEVLLAQIETQPDPLRMTGADVPEELAWLVARLLEKRRELRPATAKVLTEEIERLEQAPSAMTSAALAIPETRELKASEIPIQEPPAGMAPEPPPTVEQALISREAEPAPARIIREFSIDHFPSHSILFRLPEAPKETLRRGWWMVAALVAIALGIGGWWTFSVYRPEIAGGLRQGLTERWRARGTPPSSARPGALLATPPVASAATAGATPSKGNVVPQGTSRVEASGSKSDKGQGAPTSAGEPGGSALIPVKSSPARTAGSKTSLTLDRPTANHQAPSSAGSLAPAKPAISGAEIRRVLAEGDALFERGDYDRAILVYEGPLKLDPSIPVLRLRIERARRAKAAEEKYLGQ